MVKEILEFSADPEIVDHLSEETKRALRLDEEDFSLKLVLTIRLPANSPLWNDILRACDTYRRIKEQSKDETPPVIRWMRSVAAKEMKESSLTDRPLKRVDYGYYSVRVRRVYLHQELKEAELFAMVPRNCYSADFESEDVERTFDLQKRCRTCLAKEQIFNLVLRRPRFGKHLDIFRFFEWNVFLVSERLINVLRRNGVTGWRAQDVLCWKKSGLRVLPGWKQILITSQVDLSPRTVVGYDYFHPDHLGIGNTLCKNCRRTYMARLVSEAAIERNSWDRSDLCASTILVAGGPLTISGHPAPVLFISPRLYQIFKEERIRGYSIEVAHLV